MRRVLAVQFSIMVSRRDFRIVFLIMMALSLYDFTANLFAFYDTDVSMIFSWHYLYVGNTNSHIWNILIALYPFLIVFPFGFSYIQDCETRMLSCYIERSGKKNYFRSKITVAFVGGFLMIFIPFLINLILSYTTFPHNYLSELSYYAELTGDNVFKETVLAHKPFAWLFSHSLFWYNMLYLMLFSSFTGLMGALTFTISFFIKRYKILLFVPVFIIFMFGYYMNGPLYSNERIRFFNTNILDYFGTDAFFGQSLVLITSFIVAVVAFIFAAYKYAVRKEYLL